MAASYVHDAIVEVQVGYKYKPFRVHESLLVDIPELSKKVPKVETVAKRVWMLNENPLFYDLLFRWLYGADLTISLVGNAIHYSQAMGMFEWASDGHWFCCPLSEGAPNFWLFAERLQLPELQNAIMRLMYQFVNSPEHDQHFQKDIDNGQISEGLESIYTNTPRRSPLRALAMEYIGKICSGAYEHAARWWHCKTNPEQMQDVLAHIGRATHMCLKASKNDPKTMVDFLCARLKYDAKGEVLVDGDVHTMFLVPATEANKDFDEEWTDDDVDENDATYAALLK